METDGLMPLTEPAKPAFRFRTGWVVVVVLLGVLVICGVGVTGYFRLSSPTKALRESVMRSVGGQWDKRFAARMGWFTCALVRSWSRLLPLPPELRAALEALRGAEVGIYRLHDAPVLVDRTCLIQAADKAVGRRGWERAVTVCQHGEFVAVYLPRQGVSARGMACCLVVLHERDLVVASARGNLAPLMGLASKRLDFARLRGKPFSVLRDERSPGSLSRM
jgi:hypothetical protein